MLNELQLELTRLLGKKNVNLTDFHRWIIEKSEMYIKFSQTEDYITVNRSKTKGGSVDIRYESHKDLLSQ